MNTPFSWFIHKHFAQEMNQRLAILRHTPELIILMGADGDVSRALLAQRYPKAHFEEYDSRAQALQESLQQRKTEKIGFLDKLMGKNIPQFCQAIDAPLPEARADMLWANLSLTQTNDLPSTLAAWGQGLKTDGLLFLTHFGRDTLTEIRDYLAQHHIQCQAKVLIDMHDLGDIIYHHHFYDPVMDTAKLVLTYPQADLFWQDMHSTGLWTALQADDEPRARALITQAWQNGELSGITLETVFGHAVKKRVLPENESLVQFYPRAPKQSS